MLLNFRDKSKMTEGDKIPCAWTNQGLQSKVARWSDGTPLGPSKLLQGWVDAMKSGANMNMTPPAPGSPAYNALRHITGPGSVLNLTDEQIKTILDYVTGKDQHKKEIQIQLKNGTLSEYDNTSLCKVLGFFEDRSCGLWVAKDQS